MIGRVGFLIGLIFLGFASWTRAEEVSVAVAANFLGPFETIARRFQASTGHQLRLSGGSTGKLYAQIKGGAPFAVLLSADRETPARLEKEGLAVAETRFTYAIGALVLWSPKAGLVDDRGDILTSGRFRFLSIANPRLAPYGAAAVSVLKRRGVYEALTPKLVIGESISQAHQFVTSGNAELGFLALSQVRSEAGSRWVVPADLYPPLRQDAVLLRRGQDSPAARALLEILRGHEMDDILTAHGYRR